MKTELSYENMGCESEFRRRSGLKNSFDFRCSDMIRIWTKSQIWLPHGERSWNNDQTQFWVISHSHIHINWWVTWMNHNWIRTWIIGSWFFFPLKLHLFFSTGQKETRTFGFLEYRSEKGERTPRAKLLLTPSELRPLFSSREQMRGMDTWRAGQGRGEGGRKADTELDEFWYYIEWRGARLDGRRTFGAPLWDLEEVRESLGAPVVLRRIWRKNTHRLH